MNAAIEFHWPVPTRDFGFSRGLAALAYLAKAERPIPKRGPAELLLPDEADGVARNDLRRHMHRLSLAADRRLIQSA